MTANPMQAETPTLKEARTFLTARANRFFAGISVRVGD
jgi:hypothetical protein